MKMYKRTLILSISITLLFASPGFAQDAKEIMQKVLDRDDGTTQIFRVKLSSCRYAKKGNRIACAETPRVKVLEQVGKDYGPRGKDIKSVSIMLEPVGERGIGFLQYDYDARDKNTDQWMYLSALGKVKRIVSGSDNEPKTGSFFGSEISYEDLEARYLEDYTYKLLAEETYQERPCWVIETVPAPQRARKSSYSKSWLWIDKERNLMLKSIAFNRQGKKAKRISSSKVEQIDGIWTARQMLVNNLETGRMTVLTLETVAYNMDVQDDFLTQRTLTDRAFRERLLNQYRMFLK